MRRTLARILLGVASAAVTAFSLVIPAVAVHESTNRLVFAPATNADQSTASGTGTIDYRGGDATESRWTATFRFDGLPPEASYAVAVQGRFGEDGTPEAGEFTQICSFTTDAAGTGGCWFYFVVLIRLAVVELHAGEMGGTVVMQATRAEEGPGSITSETNRFSPVEPVAQGSSTPGATPAATPDDA